LQKEVARLEGELRNPELSADACLRSLLAEKELKIQQVHSFFLVLSFMQNI
jgi:centromeric protein E